MTKQTISSILLTMLMSMVGVKVFAQRIEAKNDDGVIIYYNIYYNKGNTELSVRHPGGIGDPRDFATYDGNIVIPSSVEYNGKTYSVTSINSEAFYESGLTSITIPSSVTSIGEEAFYGCSKLASVHITDLEAWCKIEFSLIAGNPLSYAEHLYLNGKEVTEITIPESISSISRAAFSGFKGLTSVTIPNSVTSIELGAFSGCSGLESIAVKDGNLYYDSRNNCNAIIEKSSNTLVAGCKNTIIPNNVTSIGIRAFSGCTSLENIIIPDNVISIGQNAFHGCSGLSSLTVGNNVTSIGNYAFGNCDGLTSVTIPNSVTSIGEHAFQYCRCLTSVKISDVAAWCNIKFSDSSANPLSYAHHLYLEDKEIENLIIPDDVSSIDNYAFLGCSSLTSVTIGNNVTSIGSYAFSDCNNLQYIYLTSGVFPSLSTYGINSNCQLIIPQKDYESGIPSGVTNFATYSYAPMSVQVKSKTATSASFELRPVDDPDNAVYTVATYGQTPGKNLRWKLDDKNYGIVSEKANETLAMEVQAAQVMSINKARLLSTVNESDDDQHYGFEWLRHDAPDGMSPYQVSAPLYKNQIVGTLGNLNPDKYYKYRPFYKSDDGTMFSGEWKIFTTGDYYVFFEPEVHTKKPIILSDGVIVLSLFFAEGTDEILEKGFELFKKAVEAVIGTRFADSDITKVVVSGNGTSATVEGLEPSTEYVYRSYVKTKSGTTYGEKVIFKTPLPGDANDDRKVNVADIVEIHNAKSGSPSASFNMTNADMDGNGSLTEADITAIVMIIMGMK